MSRKSKIIVCITGIVVITLALLGFTFGFFLTQIQGNESSKSIEVVTGDAKIKFTDLSESDIDEIIEPGYKVVKPFTIENIGEGRATYSIYLVDVVNNFNRKEDLTYTLYRTDGIITDTIDKDTDFSEWDTLKENIVYPTTSGPIQSNEIVEDSASYTYALKITYINHPTENQNEDQGKIFQGSINIRATASETNPFAEGTLAYNIIDNATSKETVSYNKTVYINPSEQDGTTYTIPAHATTKDNERILTYTMDDYGTSYYYRGNVEDNYVNYAGMCWRIVRIEGDGSVKLLLEDRNEQCNDKEGQDLNNNGTYFTGNWSDGNSYVFGYDSNYKADFLGYTQTNGLQNSFKTFQTSKLTTTDIEKLKVDEWCFDHNVTSTDNYGNEYYGAYTRIYTNKKPSLKCTGTKLTEFKDETDMYVGTLTADEMSFAGATDSTNYNYYLMNTYAENNPLSWWSLSPSYFFEEYGYGETAAFHLRSYGNLYSDLVSGNLYSRPAVSLKSGSVITGGDGTLEKPYIIG